jgi:hypothetical protein
MCSGTAGPRQRSGIRLQCGPGSHSLRGHSSAASLPRLPSTSPLSISNLVNRGIQWTTTRQSYTPYGYTVNTNLWIARSSGYPESMTEGSRSGSRRRRWPLIGAILLPQSSPNRAVSASRFASSRASVGLMSQEPNPQAVDAFLDAVVVGDDPALSAALKASDAADPTRISYPRGQRHSRGRDPVTGLRWRGGVDTADARDYGRAPTA